MITVCMRDNSNVYCAMWINVEISGRTIKTFLCPDDERRAGKKHARIFA